MFDNPEKELLRLQAELLAEEEDFEEEIEEEYEAQWEEDYEEEEIDPRGWSEGGFTRNMAEVLLEEEAESYRTVYYEEKAPRKRPLGCLFVLLILAFLIGGVLAWMR